MSVHVTSPAYKTKLGNPTAKSVLARLAERSDDEGASFPSVRSIALDTELSIRQVQRLLQIFDLMGLVTRHDVKAEKYDHYYQINLTMLGGDLAALFKEHFTEKQGKRLRDADPENVSETQVGDRETLISVSETFPPHPLIGVTVIEPSVEPLPLAALPVDDDEPDIPLKKTKDPRWNLIREDLKRYWNWKNTGVPMPWAGSTDGKALRLFLADNPLMEQILWQRCLNNRAKSEVPHGDNIHRWIRQLLRFHQGPRDRFDQLKPPNGESQKQQELEQKINDNIRNSAIARERILGKGREEVRTTGSVPGQVRPLLESSADNPGTDRGLVRRDPALHG